MPVPFMQPQRPPHIPQAQWEAMLQQQMHMHMMRLQQQQLLQQQFGPQHLHMQQQQLQQQHLQQQHLQQQHLQHQQAAAQHQASAHQQAVAQQQVAPQQHFPSQHQAGYQHQQHHAAGQHQAGLHQQEQRSERSAVLAAVSHAFAQARMPEGEQPSATRRITLKKRVFRGCDKDTDGYLDKDEMLSLAVLTGFEGSDQEWSIEYARLCRECNADKAIGIAQVTLLKLMDDQSDAGFYCTDKQLEEMSAALEDDSDG